MADFLFDNYKEQLLGGGNHAFADFQDDTINVALIDHGTTTPSETTHEDWADLSAALVDTAVALASKTITDGVADAADTTFTTVSGNTVESFVLYDATPGTDATRPLMLYVDSATGLPLTPNGGDVTIQWAAGGIMTF